MKPTTGMFARYVGGQIEIQNGEDYLDYLFRGEIEGVSIEGNDLKIRFVWLAKNDGTLNAPSPEWTTESQLDYSVSLEIYSVAAPDSLGRIIMQSGIVDEMCVFFPKGYTNLGGEPCQLDRSRVKGL